MNIKDAAFQVNLSQQKLKSVSQEIFGYVPNDFTDEDIAKIKNHLAMTGENSRALVASVEAQADAQITQNNPVTELAQQLRAIASNGAKIDKLRSIVSGYNYQANLDLWQGYLTFQLNQALNKQQQILTLFQAESKKLTAQAFDQMTGDIRQHIANNSGNWMTLVTGDFTQQLEALSNMEANLEATDSIYEQNIRDAIEELSKL